MKKELRVDQWRWGSLDKRLVYGAATVFFALGLMTDTMENWDTPADPVRMTVVTFNLCGFILMLIYQLINKWLIGVINVTFIVLLSMVPFSRAIHNFTPNK